MIAKLLMQLKRIFINVCHIVFLVRLQVNIYHMCTVLMRPQNVVSKFAFALKMEGRVGQQSALCLTRDSASFQEPSQILEILYDRDQCDRDPVNSVNFYEAAINLVTEVITPPLVQALFRLQQSWSKSGPTHQYCPGSIPVGRTNETEILFIVKPGSFHPF